jgi:hypothetical protein
VPEPSMPPTIWWLPDTRSPGAELLFTMLAQLPQRLM